MVVALIPAEAAVTHLPQHHQCGSEHSAAIAELRGADVGDPNRQQPARRGRPSNLEWQSVGGVVKTRQGGLAEHRQQSVARGV
jgi:hypothetical protein